ncbi:response regulator [Streptomyces armeniacus]|uniref:Response regulator n=1 Tax=Streptomyces armeniacus TaxID=83291 RepID=A0A345Y1A5_9ACTN|nr:response regulator [Streptomyces armeniacus]
MEDNLIALEAVLSSLGPHLVRADSGEEALKAMLRQEFAVVLLDVLMPGMDGFETAANIKRLDQTKDVPVILLTGNDAGPDYAYRGYTVGAADFLTKPFDPWLLRTKVSLFLELDRKNRQLAAQSEQLRGLSAREGRADSPRAAAASRTTERASAAREEQLVEVAEQLARLERLLRENAAAPGDERTGLADRVAGLERAVAGLLTPYETRPPYET